MADTLFEFKRLLAEFRGLSTWALGGLAVPFASALLSLSPPWPKAITPITSVIELLVMIFSFHFLSSAPRKTINRVMKIGAALLVTCGIVYLIGYSQYVYETPITHVRFVKGLVCTDDAQKVFGAKCPNLDMDDLNTAEYEAERLWTMPSITAVRLGLVVTWLSTFVSLSMVIAVFLLFEMRRKSRTRLARSSSQGFSA